MEAALAYQHLIDGARIERTGGKKPPGVFVRSVKVLGAVQTGPSSWLVGLLREVQAPWLVSRAGVEFVTCRVVQDNDRYRCAESTSMAAA